MCVSIILFCFISIPLYFKLQKILVSIFWIVFKWTLLFRYFHIKIFLKYHPTEKNQMIIYLQICMHFIHFFQVIWAHNKKLLERWHSFNVCLYDTCKHNLYFHNITCAHTPLFTLVLVHGYGGKSQRTTIQISKYQKLKDKLFPSDFLSLVVYIINRIL